MHCVLIVTQGRADAKTGLKQARAGLKQDINSAIKFYILSHIM